MSGARGVNELLAALLDNCGERGLRVGRAAADGTPSSSYRTDEHARLLLLTTREADAGLARQLSRLALRFVLDAQDDEGRSFDAMDDSGAWAGPATAGDAWGMSLWGLGITATTHSNDGVRASALDGFNIAARQRPLGSRASAFAALGAAEVFIDDPDNRAARRLLTHVVASVPLLGDSDRDWPEAVLGSTNGAIPDALMCAGSTLNRPGDVERGLTMLRWLVANELPCEEQSASAEQLAAEMASLSEACRRALVVTGDRSWRRSIDQCASWFGANETLTSSSGLLSEAVTAQLLRRLPPATTPRREAPAPVRVADRVP